MKPCLSKKRHRMVGYEPFSVGRVILPRTQDEYVEDEAPRTSTSFCNSSKVSSRCARSIGLKFDAAVKVSVWTIVLFRSQGSWKWLPGATS
eukprot:scaffold108193_cov70-Cyclotella_meneghiniana.AAC.1